MIYFKRSVLYVILAFVILLAIEIGFHVRTNFSKKETVQDQKSINPKSKKVLIITDSTLGKTEHPTSALAIIEKRMGEQIPDYQLVTLAENGLNSVFVQNMIGKLLNMHHPELVVLLFGDADFALSSGLDSSVLDKLATIVNRLYIWRTAKFFYYETRGVIRQTFFLADEVLNPYYLEKHFNNRNNKQYTDILKGATNYTSLNCDDKISYALWLVTNNLEVEYVKIEDDVVTCSEQLESKLRSDFILARIFRLRNQVERSEKFFLRVLERNKITKEVLANFIMLYYNNGQCTKILPVFEESLRREFFLVRNFWTVRNCFIKDPMLMAQKNAGYNYFLDLSTKFPLYRDYLLLMGNTLADQSNKVAKIESPEILWDFYVSLLFHYQYTGNEESLNDIFTQKNKFAQDGVQSLGINRDAYRGVIKQILNAGSKVLVVKYPNKPDFYVDDAIAPFGNKVSILNLSDAFSRNIYEYNISQLFYDDFFHLSDPGHLVSADAIFEKIKEVIGASKNESINNRGR